MEILRAELGRCGGLSGTVVVIDVLRSFSTAAYAFAGGARAIYPVQTAAEARALRSRFPAALTMGAEGGGVPIRDFDLTNSPAALAGRDLRGRDIIHCTAGGVRGLVSCRNADALFAASLVCARATAHALRRLAPPSVTLVVTGDWTDRDGDEDRACADYLEALLRDDAPDPAPFVMRVRASDFGRRFTDPASVALPAADLDYCAVADRVEFAMRVRPFDDDLVMEPIAAGTFDALDPGLHPVH
jgi:2-phosphosulfolactate phosphatase